jgi:intracellular septation protein A
VAFYGLHLAGATDCVALLAASGAAALRLVWGAVRDRRLNLFAVVMLVVFGVGLALALIGGDPRFLLLKDSVTTAAVGLTFVVTTLFGRPLTFAAMQSFNPTKADYLAQRYATNPRVRHGYRLTSWV